MAARRRAHDDSAAPWSGARRTATGGSLRCRRTRKSRADGREETGTRAGPAIGKRDVATGMPPGPTATPDGS